MAVTIVTKWGSRAPTADDLVQGELAVDLVGKVLYTKDGNGQVITVGGGRIDWGQIDNIPEEITNIIDGVIDLDDLIQRVEDLEGNQADILQDLADLKADVGQIGKDITALAGRVSQNESDIQDLKDALDGDLTGLYLGGTYNVPTNQVSDVTSAATTNGISVGDSLTTHSLAKNEGMYFVCEGEGTLSGTQRSGSDGQFAQSGDWLVCDGTHGWILMSFGGDHVTWGSIGGTLSNQTDLQAELDKKFEDGDTLDGGRYPL